MRNFMSTFFLKECHIWFTTGPLKPLSDTRWQKYFFFLQKIGDIKELLLFTVRKLMISQLCLTRKRLKGFHCESSKSQMGFLLKLRLQFILFKLVLSPGLQFLLFKLVLSSGLQFLLFKLVLSPRLQFLLLN